MIRSIFLYLDRTWILQTSGVQGLWDMGLHLFRDYVVVDAYRTKAVDACLQLIERDRYNS